MLRIKLKGFLVNLLIHMEFLLSFLSGDIFSKINNTKTIFCTISSFYYRAIVSLHLSFIFVVSLSGRFQCNNCMCAMRKLENSCAHWLLGPQVAGWVVHLRHWRTKKWCVLCCFFGSVIDCLFWYDISCDLSVRITNTMTSQLE